MSPVDPQTIGALLSKAMHDEENVRGLTVTSLADGDQGWMAFGDGQILEEKASVHAQRAVRALQVGACAGLDRPLRSARPDSAVTA